MNDNETENLLDRDIIYDDNHNYFQIGIEPVNAVVDNETALGAGDYQTLVPLVGTRETNNVVQVQDKAEATETNYTEVVQKKKNYSDNAGDDEAGNENDVSSDDEENLATGPKSNDKGYSKDMFWEDLRPMFACNKCSYGFKKRYLLVRHLKTHHHKSKTGNSEDITDATRSDEKDVNCGDDNLFQTNIIKDSELEPHSTFACNKCSYITNKRYLLSRHIKIHSADRPHKCKICERGFTTGASLQAHVNAHYGVKNQICKYCERSFTTSGELSRHVKYKHTQEKPHKCTECDYAAVESSKLQRHMRYHNGERPFQCQHCTYASQDKYQLKRHLRSHTGEKPYKCDNCNASYAYSTSLKLHKFTHNPSETKVHSCKLCSTENARKSELRQHIKRMHFSDKPLQCKRCEETFSDRYTYKLHNETHKCEKYFKCQLCSFSAKKFTDLKMHMTQAGETPMNVDQTSITNSFLCRHQYECHQNKTYLLKEKPYQCQICKRTFAYRAFLIRHEAYHNKEHTKAHE